METIIIKPIEVQKELMSKKVEANFSHYTAGNLYYTVGLVDSAPMGTYQFPIRTIETGTIEKIIGHCETKDLDNEGYLDVSGLYTKEEVEKFYERRKASDERDGILIESNPVEVQLFKLSEDLGTTSFSNKMKGSELNRWIKKAIEKGDFIRVA
jgi:hypothetical protein